MVQKILFVVFISAFFRVNSAAQENTGYNPRLTGSAPYSDPVYQDFIETSYGYLNPNNAINIRGDFRDALAPLDTQSRTAPGRMTAPEATGTPESEARDRPESQSRTAPEETAGIRTAGEGKGIGKVTATSCRPLNCASHPTLTSTSTFPTPQPLLAVVKGLQSLPDLPVDYYKVTFAGESGPIASFVKPLGREGVSPGEYVFVSILPKEKNYSGMLKEIAVSAGFRFSGEKTIYLKNAGKTVVLGWAQSARVDAIYKNPKVAGVSVEKKSSGLPFKTRVKFTLKVPYRNHPGVFVSRFIKNLGSDKGFVSENVFRLPSSGGSSKFTAFDVTGSIPVEMVGELSSSPFVVSVESAL